MFDLHKTNSFKRVQHEAHLTLTFYFVHMTLKIIFLISYYTEFQLAQSLILLK